MLTRRDWIIYVLAPFILCLFVDQWTKVISSNWVGEAQYGPLSLIPFKNVGFMMGGFGSLSKIYTIVFPATLAGFVVFSFLAVQYFLPIKSSILRAGVSIFIASLLSNVLDRVRLGYVVDFIYFNFGSFETGIFNVADSLQWVGVALISYGYASAGGLLYPEDQRRNQVWVDPAFQIRYCAALVVVGFCFALTLGLLSYTFLSVTLSQIADVNVIVSRQMLQSFVILYSVTSFVFLLCILAAGVWLSHRVVGPVKGFENFLEDLLEGKSRQFKVRQMDEFGQLERIAARYTEFFHDRLGVAPEPLKAGAMSPQFQAETAKSEVFNLADYADKKVWLIFYRYATCPICALRLELSRNLIDRAKANGVAVVIVFESRKDQFDKPECGETSALLRDCGAILVADPERQIYKKFRTRLDVIKMVRPITIIRLLQARMKGYVQGSIDGELGQMPCDVLIGKDYKIQKIHYGTNVDDRISEEDVVLFIESKG